MRPSRSIRVLASFWAHNDTPNKLLPLLPPSGITLHSVFGQSQTIQILTKHIGKIINNYETKYMQYENIFYDNSNDGYFIL
jgi:hypothetical protein